MNLDCEPINIQLTRMIQFTENNDKYNSVTTMISYFTDNNYYFIIQFTENNDTVFDNNHSVLLSHIAYQ